MSRARASRLRAAISGTGRWVRPAGRAVFVLAAGAVAIVAAGGAALYWVMRSPPPERALALAATVLAGPPALDSALGVSWRWAVSEADAGDDRWLALGAPGLPPGICLPQGVAVPDPGLDPALRQLDAAVGNGAGRDELERRLLAVREAGSASPGSRLDFIVRYGLARGYARAGDWAMAGQLLEPVLEGWISLDRLPTANPVRRPLTVRDGVVVLPSGPVDEALTLEAIHGRYLAGTIAYHRGEANTAIAHFRRTINAVYYLLALRGEGDLGPERHYQRVEAELGPAGCPGASSRGALTSLDAYGGLVAAYMAAPDFTDPGQLRGELVRARFEMDRDDPLGPVIEQARGASGGPIDTAIPENLVWAASNLQKVYHFNRLSPDPDLTVTRAVLLLHLTERPEWVDALAQGGEAELCGMLSGVAHDLRSDAPAFELGPSRESATDSARAAVAVRTFARLEAECPGVEDNEIDPVVRSAWLRLGGEHLAWGLPGVYEGVRREIADALSTGSATVPVLEDRLRPHLDRVRGQMRMLRRGRVPGELPASVPTDRASRFAEAWWRALHRDVARALLTRARGGEGPEARPVTAYEVPAFLAAIEAVTAHGGTDARVLYSASELAPLAASLGRGRALLWRARMEARELPAVAFAVVAAVALALLALALFVHVNVWRYRVLTGSRFYRAEARARGRQPVGEAR